MDILGILSPLLTNVMNRIWPDPTEREKAKLAQFEAEIRLELARNELLKGQLEVNKAEALNPNRKWITWRELLGYGLSFAVIWDLLIKQFLIFLMSAAGHPIDLNTLPKLDMANVLYILGAMLGIQIMPATIDATKSVYNKVRGK